ncbi:hypothetical protein D1817_06235 [Flavobacteriaceae bacterium]|nr:hypothetical protein D1817_06235 [Flavobacteriaceae bacterium]
MKEIKNIWINNPSRKQLIVFISLWFIGITLLALVVTDLFTETLFQSKNSIVLLLMGTSTVVIFKLLLNYIKNSK